MKLREILQNNETLRDVKTGTNIIVAVVLAVVTKGLFRGFDPKLLADYTTFLSSFSMYISLGIIQNEFTDRALLDQRFDEKSKTYELEEKIKLESEKVDMDYATEWVNEWNRKGYADTRKETKATMIQEYKSQIANLKNKIAVMEIKPISKWQFMKKRRYSKYNKAVAKCQRKLQNVKEDRFKVVFHPIELDDIRTIVDMSKDKKKSKRDKLRYSPVSDVRAKARTKMVVKTFLMFILNGAVIATADDWVEIATYVAFILPTLAWTAFSMYDKSKRATKYQYVPFLKEKYDMLIDINLASETKRQEEEPEEYVPQYLEKITAKA